MTPSALSVEIFSPRLAGERAHLVESRRSSCPAVADDCGA